MNEVEQLTQVYNNHLNQEPIILGKIKEFKDIYFYAYGIGGKNVIYALYNFYIRHDIRAAKENFYKTAVLAEYMSAKFDRRVIDSGISEMSYALLSDNQDLIALYSVMKNKINHEIGIGYQIPNSMQNILLENWIGLDWNIHCLERFTKMPRFAHWIGIVDILNGFKNKDQGLIKSGLLEILSRYEKRKEGDYLIYKFFSIDTSGFTKLAWIKGYEIDLNTPLVPIELMPVKPLEHYSSYDFLAL